MDDAVQLLLETVKIYSPSEKEAKLAKFLRGRMKHLGFRNTRIDSAGNAIGEIGAGKPHLLLCGHMDTVPGELPVSLDGNRILGRGAVDAKSPLCAMIMAASRLASKNLKLTVACATREEGDSLGIETLLDSGGDYGFAIFGEPGGASRVTVGYRGRIQAHLQATTAGGHAASPWAHPSAVDEAIGLVERFRIYEKEHSNLENRYRSLSIALTMIEGGIYPNVIPSKCELTLDIRVPAGMSGSGVQADLRRIATEYQEGRGASRFELTFEKPTEPYETDPNSVMIRSFQRSIIKNLGEKPSLLHKTGTGDMNTLAERMRIPCATYGPGDPRLSHTGQEYVEVNDYLNSIKVLEGVFSEIEALSSKD